MEKRETKEKMNSTKINERISNADVEALTKILNEIVSFSSNLDDLYSEASLELTKRYINNSGSNSKTSRKLSFTGAKVLFSVPPSHTWSELQEISDNVHKLTTRLTQMRAEQRKSEEESKLTFNRLQNERDSLLLQLESIRSIRPKKTQTDELLRRIASNQYN